MIKGIGIDIVELDRIEKSLQNERFIDRILTANEQKIYQQLASSKRKIEYMAGRFAAKEACSKALGTGIGKTLRFHDVEVINDTSGAPTITIKHLCDYRLFISISHSETYAIAQVVMEE